MIPLIAAGVVCRLAFSTSLEAAVIQDRCLVGPRLRASEITRSRTCGRVCDME